jgi:N-acetylglucosaminyl-diphospho-decaprenol L-rhamnosyltransferase
VSGALMAMAKTSFTKLGGFDPAFFLHVEDIDLCQRTRDAGGRVLFNPRATALHIGATSQVSSWAVERAKTAGFARYFWKNARGLLGQLAVIIMMPMIAAGVTVRWILTQRPLSR